MMDDLPEPVEEALIVYDRLEQALRRPPLAQLARLLGIVLGAGSVAVLGHLVLARAWAVAPGAATLTLAGALLTGAIGAALVRRQAWALAACFVLVPLHGLATLAGVTVFHPLRGNPGNLLALALEAAVLVACGVIVAGTSSSGRPGEAELEALRDRNASARAKEAHPADTGPGA